MCDHSLILSFIKTHYGLVGKLKNLPSYIDKNFLFTANATSTGDDTFQYVIKISSQSTSIAEIECENAAMKHVASKQINIQTPIVIESVDQQDLLNFTWPDTSVSKLRIVNFLPGDLYSQVDTEDAGLHKSLGDLTGQITQAFNDFKHPAAHRESNWDIAQLAQLEPNLSYYQGLKKSRLTSHFLDFKNNTLPALDLLPKQVIHNDINDNNLIVTQVDGQLSCTGLFDFGDIVYTQRLCELAVTMTYALMSQKNFLKTAKNIYQGYQLTVELGESEKVLLPKLIIARLLQSLLNSGKSFALEPENEYLLVSAAPAWDLLEKFESLKPDEFINALR
jgi:Ser/Thr protein kinase RdoA (MazF antagonist)